MSTKFRTIQSKGYLPVASNRLIVGTKLPCDLYMKEGGIFRILFDAGTDYTKITREVLIDRGFTELYVPDGDKQLLYAYVSESIDDCASVMDSPRAFKDYTFRKDKYYRIDKHMLVPGTDVPFCIYSMKHYDYSLLLNATSGDPGKIDEKVLSFPGDVLILQSDIPLYTEYLNTVQQSPNLSGKNIQRMKALVVREKSKIIVKDLFDNPRSGETIQQAQGAVNIQSHVYEGEKLVKENSRIPHESFAAISEHHEKISGSGYPAHLAEKQITLFGRTTAIADCYDALTTARPCRQALTPFYALATVAKETANYDPEILKSFIRMPGKV